MQSVLIIDSDPTFCYQVSQMLEALALQVISAESRAGGEQSADTIGPDLIVLSADLDGKKNGGFIVCKNLKDKATTKSIPIILLAANPDEPMIKKHKKLPSHADAYLQREDNNSLLRTVTELLGMEVNTSIPDNAPPMDPSLDHLDTSGEQNTGDDAQLQDLRDQMESMEQRNNYLEKELGAFKDGTKMLEAQIQNTKKELQQKSDELERLQGRLVDLENVEDSAADLKTRVQQLEKEAGHRENSLQEQQGETEKQAGEITRLQSELESAQKKLEASLTDLSDSREEQEDQKRKITDLEGKLESAKQAREGKEDALEKAMSDKLALEMEVDGLRSDLETAKRETSQAQDEAKDERQTQEHEKAQLAKELEQAQSRIQEQEATLTRNQEAQSLLDNKLNEFNARTDEATKERDDALNGMRTLKAQLDAVTGENKDLSSKLSDAEDRQQNFDKILTDKLGQIERIKKVNQELENELEASLKEKGHLEETFAKGTENQKKAHEEDLRTHQAEANRERTRLNDKISLLAAEKETLIKGFTQEKSDTRERYEGLVRDLKDKLEAANTNYHTEKELAFSLNKKLKAKEEESQENLEKQRQSHETELSRLKLEHEEELSRVKSDMQKQQDDQNKRIVALEQSNSAYDLQVAQLEKKVSEEESAHAAAREAASDRMAALESKLQSGESALSREKDRADNLETELAEARRQALVEAESAEKRLEEQKQRHVEAADEQEQRISALTSEINGQRETLEAYALLKQEHESLTRHINRLTDENEANSDRLKRAAELMEKSLRELKGEAMEAALKDS